MDSLHYTVIFNLVKKNKVSGKNLLKVVKLQNLVNLNVMWKMQPLHLEIVTTFGSKMVTIST